MYLRYEVKIKLSNVHDKNLNQERQNSRNFPYSSKIKSIIDFLNGKYGNKKRNSPDSDRSEKY